MRGWSEVRSTWQYPASLHAGFRSPIQASRPGCKCGPEKQFDEANATGSMQTILSHAEADYGRHAEGTTAKTPMLAFV